MRALTTLLALFVLLATGAIGIGPYGAARQTSPGGTRYGAALAGGVAAVSPVAGRVLPDSTAVDTLSGRTGATGVGSYTTNGYRVQVYAGGNTRADKNRAYDAGSVMRSCFPDQPVYVHFYSPRWKCLMGNFRTYAEAAELMREVREIGYPAACVVKGKITVNY